MPEGQLYLVPEALRAIRSFARILTLVNDSGEELNQFNALLNTQELDPMKAFAHISTIEANTDQAHKESEYIKRYFGGPRGTTGYDSPVELCVQQSDIWVARLSAIKDQATRQLEERMISNLRRQYDA